MRGPVLGAMRRAVSGGMRTAMYAIERWKCAWNEWMVGRGGGKRTPHAIEWAARHQLGGERVACAAYAAFSLHPTTLPRSPSPATVSPHNAPSQPVSCYRLTPQRSLPAHLLLPSHPTPLHSSQPALLHNAPSQPGSHTHPPPRQVPCTQPEHVESEQSSPAQPSSHAQPLAEHRPRSEQRLGQSWFSQPAPLKPSSQAHLPLKHCHKKDSKSARAL